MFLQRWRSVHVRACGSTVWLDRPHLLRAKGHVSDCFELIFQACNSYIRVSLKLTGKKSPVQYGVVILYALQVRWL